MKLHKAGKPGDVGKPCRSLTEVALGLARINCI
jgi:hypothetical protein